MQAILSTKKRELGYQRDIEISRDAIALVSQSAPDVQRAYIQAVDAIAQRMHPTERLTVSEWTDGILYLSVKDTRWKHYPCDMRLLVSFNTATGNLAAPTEPHYAFARKGWGIFLSRLIGYTAPLYKECGNHEKTTYC